MAESPFLGLTHIEPQQAQIDVPVNADFDRLSRAVCGLLAKTVTTANVTLTATEGREAIYIRVTGALTANRSLIVPNENKLYIVEHAGTGGFVLTVKTSAGSGVGVSQGNTQAVYADGTNVVQVTLPTSAAGGIHDFAGFFVGKPGAGAVMFSYAVTRACQLPAGLTNSVYKAGTAATGSATFSIKKNGSEIGTLNFAASATTATFTMASATSFANGDVLDVVAPGSQDATLADIRGTLAATRT